MKYNMLRKAFMATTAAAGLIHPAMAQDVVSSTLQTAGAPSELQTKSPTATTGNAVIGETNTPAAQADAAPAQTDSGDIVVTARRRAEDLSRVPVTVSVLTADTLVRANVTDSFSAFQNVPALTSFNRIVGFRGASTQARIRGVVGVPSYFSEAPAGDSQFLFYSPFFDVESIQVLKGPQGTLFGSASNGGAILIEPIKPGWKFGGYVQAQLGDFGNKSIEGAVDLPLIADKLTVRLSGKSYRRDGYIKDVITGWRNGETDYDILRGIIIAEPFQGLRSETILQIDRTQNYGNTTVLSDFNFAPTSQVPIIATQAALNGMTVPEFNAARDRLLARQLALGPYRFEGYSVGCPASSGSPSTKSTVPGPNVEAAIPSPCHPAQGIHVGYLALNKTTVDITETVALKNIFSRSWGWSNPRRGVGDSDFTRLVLFEANPRSNARRDDALVWSNELQLAGKLFDRLDFVAGGIYMSNRAKPGTYPNFGSFITSLADTASLTTTRTQSWGFYGQGDLDLVDWVPGVSITGGLRWTRDKAESITRVYNPTTLLQTSTTAGPGTPAGEGAWTAVDYTVGIKYQASDNTMVYLNNSRGHTAGGLQPVVGFEKFDPDTLTNLEAGIKTRMDLGASWRLRANAAGFYGWYDNVKVTQVVLVTTPGTGASALVGAVQNAATARIHGFELGADLSGPSFSTSLDLAYTKAKYVDYPSIDSATRLPVDLSSTPFQATPKWQATWSTTYSVPMDTAKYGDLSFNLTGTARSQIAVSTRPLVPTNPANPQSGAICKVARTAANGYGPLSADGGTAYRDCLPAWYNVNLSVTWDNPLGAHGWRTQLNITNLTNNSKPAATSAFSASSAFEQIVVNPPRMISAVVRYSF